MGGYRRKKNKCVVEEEQWGRVGRRTVTELKRKHGGEKMKRPVMALEEKKKKSHVNILPEIYSRTLINETLLKKICVKDCVILS